jgi:CheY-like chemotaxis protein
MSESELSKEKSWILIPTKKSKTDNLQTQKRKMKVPFYLNTEKGRDSMKVLIVDDSPEMRGILKHFIRPICEDIYECDDGSDALDCYRKYKPDWVLMDWQMKKVDGIVATRLITELYPDAHICMVTSFKDDDLKKEALNAGAVEFVLKDDLLRLRKILTNQ